MTMTETAPTARGNGRNGQENGTALTDQVVLSGAGLAAQGIGGVRRVVDGVISTVDALVAGGFDLADQLVESNVAADLAAKALSAARQSWLTGVATAREAVGTI